MTQDSEVQAEVRRLVALWSAEKLVDTVVTANLDSVFADRRHDAIFETYLRQSVTENTRLIRDDLAGIRGLDKAKPHKPVELAMLQADLGIAQAELQRSYRVGLRALWTSWSELVTAEARASLRYAVLRWSTARVLDSFTIVATWAAAGYAERDGALRRTGAQVRRRLVEELLAGEITTTTDDYFVSLRYDVSAEHLAVHLTIDSDERASRIGEELRRRAGASGFLVMRPHAAQAYLWLSKPTGWTLEARRAVVGHLQSDGVGASVSDPALGVDGFREAHLDATRVEKIRRALPGAPAVLELEEVRLEALLVSNEAEARRFVIRELGGLGEANRRTALLRDTVLASLGSRSHVATAERLGLHEHTVRNRLQRAEQLLERALDVRRAELQVALRLHRVLYGNGGGIADQVTASDRPAR